MAKKDILKKISRGLAAVFATVLSIGIGCTVLLYQWEPLVNEKLGITVGNTVVGGNENVDTVYYKSSFGDISAMYKSNPTDAEKAALEETQNKLLAAEKAFAIREQEEGSVLLKNEIVDGVNALPLANEERNVTLFGNASGHPLHRSTSAGASATGARSISYAQALRDAGFSINETLQSALEKSGVNRESSEANGVASIGEVPVSFYTQYERTFDSYNDVAIVMLVRTAGEGKDVNTRDKDGMRQLQLHEEEAALLKMIKNSNKFGKTIVLIGGGYAMELGWLFEEEYGVDAAMWIGEPGLFGFVGVANLLTGDANPSGRLVDIYAANSFSAPAMQNFGDISFTNNNSYKYVVEAEGIYIGYKYYETRYEDLILGHGSADSAKGSTISGEAWNYAKEVVFPFGYGLSYTTFSQTLGDITYNEETGVYSVPVTVKNTGNLPGKYAVQVYAQTPYDKDVAESPSIRLVGFNKTFGTTSSGEKETAALDSREAGMLQPGEEEEVVIEVDKYFLTSYSEKARNGKGGYVLTAGEYYLTVGQNAHDALNNILTEKGATGLYNENGETVTGNTDLVAKLGTWEYDESSYSKSLYTDAVVENKLEKTSLEYWVKNAVTYLSRSDWDGTYPTRVELALTDAMKKEMDAGVYKASSSATPKGTYKQDQKNGIDLIDMKDVPFSGTYTDAEGNTKNADEMWEKFLNQLSLDELAFNTTNSSPKSAASVNAPKATETDGPDGVGGTMQNKTAATCYPSQIVAASAFNPKTLRMRGDFEGEDGLFTKVAVLWSPGGNIHRTPYSGRNFEYYSECGYMGYLCASYQVPAMQAKGIICSIKHFVGNNQETNRHNVSTFNTEQAWRENSLKIFEGAIAKGEALGVMTALSNIGCTPAPSNGETNLGIMVKEWGFKGINITDGSGNQKYINSVDTIMNGTTMYCLDNRESDLKRESSRSKYDDILGEMRQASKQFYYTLLHSNAINGIAPGAKVSADFPWWKPVVIILDVVVGVLALLSAGAYVFLTYIKKEKTQQEGDSE